MFRPVPKATLFRRIPYRLIAFVVLILALVVAAILLFSLEHEKLLLQGFTQSQTIPTQLFPALGQSRRDLILVTLLVFLVGAVGIVRSSPSSTTTAPAAPWRKSRGSRGIFSKVSRPAS